MTDETLHFRANTRLKDLIGRGLILNDNVALIELIKNSSDANSSEVRVSFENAVQFSLGSKIVVHDTGHGMSLDDFRTKWLNIAFSAKRNQVSTGRPIAGEKGVGRFSCDRLGRKLRLISKRANHAAFEAIINWEDFEIDDIDLEISSIDVIARELTSAEYVAEAGSTSSGTILIIEHLRSVWDNDKLSYLKKELERFIIDPEKKFKVHLKSLDIKNISGSLVYDSYIENRLFEKLSDKTTSVYSEISRDGEEITTEIRHEGVPIISYKSKNTFEDLRRIGAFVQIHYLNPGAKVSFKNITGYTSAEYGSVMMFLNGFRVMPYGEPDNDWLGLNRRKAQGTSRYLGGREVFGRVEIADQNRVIIPVTSREGVENNPAFNQLTSTDVGDGNLGFVHSAFRALETYVVRGLDWDRVVPKDGNYSFRETFDAMLSAVNQIENRHKLTDIVINEPEIRRIAKGKIEEYDHFLARLKEEVADKSAYELTPSEKRNVTKFVGRVDAQVQAVRATNAEVKKVAEVERKRRLFAEARAKPATIKNDELVHHMRLLSDKIGADLREALIFLRDKSPDVGLASLETNIQSALFHNEKLTKLARVVSRADFDMMSDQLTEDLLSYIDQYVSDLISYGSIYKLSVQFSNPENISLLIHFSPIEIAMLVDNVLENAASAGARNLEIIAVEDAQTISLIFSNDGANLTERYPSTDLFEAGITTTTGSGIGLSQVRRIAGEIDAEVTIENNTGKGVSVIMRWEK